jgi:RNA polymerase primary sigma factor
MKALNGRDHVAGSVDIAELLNEARTTDSWVRHEALAREIASIVAEERYEAGPIESQDVYFRQVGMIPMLSASDELILFRRMEKERGEADRKHTREQIIRSHLRLVIAIAREYRGRGLPFMDLIQEGNLGLEKAVDRFDYRRGNRLSTFAIWSIDSAISRGLANKARTIRIPVSVQQKLIKIGRVERHYDREPTVKELSRDTRFSVEEIEWLKRRTTPPVSLDAAPSDQKRERRELIADGSVPSPEEEVIREESEEALRDAMSHLLPRQRRVLELRFGFGKEGPMSLQEVGNELGVSRERVRQIEDEALQRLRRLLRSEEPT